MRPLGGQYTSNCCCCLFTAQAHYRDHGKLTYARSVFVIHNIAHQVGGWVGRWVGGWVGGGHSGSSSSGGSSSATAPAGGCQHGQPQPQQQQQVATAARSLSVAARWHIAFPRADPPDCADAACDDDVVQGRGPMDELQNLEVPPNYVENFRWVGNICVWRTSGGKYIKVHQNVI